MGEVLQRAAAAASLDDVLAAILPMPGVVHAGQQTGADTVYMEVRPAHTDGC